LSSSLSGANDHLNASIESHPTTSRLTLAKDIS
jgi:hypothetical protein